MKSISKTLSTFTVNNIKLPVNLYLGLKQKFNNYNEALEMILSSEMPTEEDLEDEKYYLFIRQQIFRNLSRSH